MAGGEFRDLVEGGSVTRLIACLMDPMVEILAGIALAGVIYGAFL